MEPTQPLENGQCDDQDTVCRPGHVSAARAPLPRRARAGRHLPEVLIVFCIGVAMMRSIHSGDPGVPGHDSFYHVKMAALTWEHGVLHEFPWLKFTYFTDEGKGFVSHHYGFHVLLSPFVHLSYWLTGDYLPGARWAMAGFFGVLLVLFDLILLSGGLRWRWLWLLLCCLMPFQFFTRHAYIRAMCPSLAFMLLILLLIFRRRHALTALAIAAYTHLYLGGVIYAPLLVGLFVLSSVIGPANDRAVPWRLVLWAAAGWAVGVLTHPYSAGMWEFLRLQIFGSGLSPDISVGREWKPYEGLWWFAQMSGTVLIAWAIALCARLRLGKPVCPNEFMLLLAHFVFLGLTFKARRFIEYWPVFCLLSTAFLAAPLTAQFATWCERSAAGASRAVWMRRAAASLTVVAVLLIIYVSPLWLGIRSASTCKYDLPEVKDAMDFLRQHSRPGDVVFTDDWDIFPVLFYYNSHNHYIVGLDPKFTHARRPILWERYVKVSRGQIPANVSVESPDGLTGKDPVTVHVTLEDIREHFGAAFVVTDRDHRSLAAKLAARKDFAELIYPSPSYRESRDAPYLIFRIEEDGEDGAVQGVVPGDD